MSETGEGKATPQTEFISNSLGITHFIKGEGSLEKPYKPQGGTLLTDSIMDSYNTAIYLKDKEAKVFFEHNRHIVGIDRNMQASFVKKEDGTTEIEFQKSVEEITKQLREEIPRPLTEQESVEWQEELKKQVAKNERQASEPKKIVDRIFEKFGL